MQEKNKENLLIAERFAAWVDSAFESRVSAAEYFGFSPQALQNYLPPSPRSRPGPLMQAKIAAKGGDVAYIMYGVVQMSAEELAIVQRLRGMGITTEDQFLSYCVITVQRTAQENELQSMELQVK